MANVVRKFYRYLSASANRKLDERADPRVQIDQAMDESRKQHKALLEQAASVIGNRKQLEMQIARQIETVETLADSARQSVLLAERARATGDLAEADRYEQTAHTFAGELVGAEASLNDSKVLYDQAVASSEQARRAVEDNEARLRRQLAERSRLLTQLEHTAMQERMSAAMGGMSGLEPSGDTPTFGEIRDKIEHRYAVATGRQELASQGVEAKMIEIRRATLDARASDRLGQIRAAMAAGEGAGGTGQTSLTGGGRAASITGGENGGGSGTGSGERPGSADSPRLTKGEQSDAEQPAGGSGA
ncbi:MAG: PspA/IM30 family protein [Frankia sp.]